MVDREELALERADPLGLPFRDGQRVRRDPALGQLRLDQRQRELGADQRDVGLVGQQVGHRADVVLVAVGQHDRLHVVEPVHDRREVRQDQVDAGLVDVGEQHAAVDDQQLAVVLEDGHVATDGTEAAERDDAQRTGGERRRAHPAPAWAWLMRAAPTASSSVTPAAAASAPQLWRSRPSVASTSGSRTGPAGRPEQVEAGLDQDDALGPEDAGEERQQLVVQRERAVGDVAALVRLDHLLRAGADEVGRRADHADRADREQRQRQRRRRRSR